MSQLKMNTFHWHLTNDQGWRIEVKKYPKLTEIGAFRDSSEINHFGSDVYDGKRHGGFYTQEDIKEIVDYASKRHITIVPEVSILRTCQCGYRFLSLVGYKRKADQSSWKIWSAL